MTARLVHHTRARWYLARGWRYARRQLGLHGAHGAVLIVRGKL